MWKVADNRPIVSFTNDQLELLTLVRFWRSRSSDRSRMFQRACDIMEMVEGLLARGYPYQCSHAQLRELEQEMQSLLQQIASLVAQEAAERAVLRAA